MGESEYKLQQTFVTFYWAEREDVPSSVDRGSILRSGRTTVKFLLPVPLKEILPGRALYRTPYIDYFRLDSPDHLERRGDYYNELDGVRMAKKVALALNFMAVTGLRAPLANEMPRSRLKLSDNADHCSYWYDNESQCIVILDEPYRPLFHDEIAWANDHGFHTVGVPWRGIYEAGYTPRLHATSEAALSRLIVKLKALENRLNGEKWTYDSQGYETQFISPARHLSGKRKKPRVMPTPQGVERAGAVPCGPDLPGYPSSWRPARRLDLDRHLHIGPIMSSLMASVIMAWSGAGLGRVGGTLSAWFRSEYKDEELPNEHSRQIYDLPKPTIIRGIDKQLAALAEVKQTIVEGYQECKPKRELLERIDRADRWIRRNLAHLEAMEAMEADISAHRLAESRRGDGVAQ